MRRRDGVERRTCSSPKLWEWRRLRQIPGSAHSSSDVGPHLETSLEGMDVPDDCHRYRSARLEPVGLDATRDLRALQGTRRDSLVPRAWPPGRNPSCEFAPARPSQGASPCDGFHEVLAAPRVSSDACRGRAARAPVTVAAVAHARYSCTFRDAGIHSDPAALRGPFQSSHSLGAVPISRPLPSCGSPRAALQPLTRAPAPGLRSPRRAPRGVKSPVANSRRVHPSRACPPPSWSPVSFPAHPPARFSRRGPSILEAQRPGVL
jgi:hypothetical protein